MKIKGITKTQRSRKASVYEAVDVNLSMEGLIKNEIIDWNGYHASMKLRKIKLKKHPDVFEGIITFKKIKEFASFLIDEYVPIGDSYMDKMIKELNSISRKQKIETLVDFIAKQYYGTKSIFYNDDGEYMHERMFYEESGLLAHRNVITLKNGASGVLFCKSETGKILYYEKPANILGKDIHRSNFIILQKDSPVMLYWDGNRMQLIYINENHAFSKNVLSKHIGEEEYDRFDAMGKIVNIQTWKEMIPPSDFKGEYMVKVPKRNEIKKELLKSDYISEMTERPYFLYDIKSSVLLNDNLKIIDNIEDAANIYSRMIDGVYMQDNNPSFSTLCMFSDNADSYYVFGRAGEYI